MSLPGSLIIFLPNLPVEHQKHSLYRELFRCTKILLRPTPALQTDLLVRSIHKRIMHASTILTTILTTAPSLISTASIPRNTTTKNTTSNYILKDDLSYENFFSSFDFFAGPDPTHGFVQYLNASSAISRNLIGYYNDTSTIYIGVDSVSKDSKGRSSVRLESKKSWNKGLLIADIHHMPQSECGVWGAYWLLGAGMEWPEGGEIDVVEGVNEQVRNAVTLHTAKGCVVDNSTSSHHTHSLPPSPHLSPDDSGSGSGSDSDSTTSDSTAQNTFTGTLTTGDCDINALGQFKNVGCSIAAPKYITNVALGGTRDANTPLPSFGTPFNNAEGGIYALEWTSTSISVWFIPRYSPLFDTYFTPASSSTDTSNSTTPSPDPSLWGPPMAHFSGSGCDFEQRFKDLKIIFNIDFCGDWAGEEWDESCKKKTGVQTCEEYVRDNPEKFEEAFWEVGRVEWWQKA